MSLPAYVSRFLWAMLLVLPAVAHSHVDQGTGQDYRGFDRNDGQGPCCDWHDCRRAFGPIAEQDGETIMDLDYNKYPFDIDKVVKRPSDDGNWHICASPATLFCIIAPAEASRQSDRPRMNSSWNGTKPLPYWWDGKQN
jgi:hypothetical protein